MDQPGVAMQLLLIGKEIHSRIYSRIYSSPAVQSEDKGRGAAWVKLLQVIPKKMVSGLCVRMREWKWKLPRRELVKENSGISQDIYWGLCPTRSLLGAIGSNYLDQLELFHRFVLSI